MGVNIGTGGNLDIIFNERQVGQVEQHCEHNRTQTQTRPDIDCISRHNTCKCTTKCGTRTWQQLQQQTADSTATRGCTDLTVSSLLLVLREGQTAQQQKTADSTAARGCTDAT